jgi:hypothetical protein
VDSDGDDDYDTDDNPCPTADAGSGNYPDAGDSAIILSDVRVINDIDLTSGGEGPLQTVTIQSGKTEDPGTRLALAADIETSGNFSNASKGLSSASNGLSLLEQNSGLSGSLTVNGNLSNSGLITGTAGESITVSGTFSNTGNNAYAGTGEEVIKAGIDMDGGTLDLASGTNSGNLDLGGGQLSASLVFNNASNDTLTVGNGGNVDLESNFTNQANALFDLGTGTLNIAADITNADNMSGVGIFRTSTGGEVVFDGDSLSVGSQSIKGNFAGTNNFEDITVESGSKVDPVDDLVGSKPVTISGKLDVQGVYGLVGEQSNVLYNGFDFSIGGDFRANELSFNNPPSDSENPVEASGEVFSLVRLTGGTFVQLDSEFIINGLLIIDSSDQLDLIAGGSLVLNDDFENNGTYTPGLLPTTFRGQTNTGSDINSCDSADRTSDGDCEQDVRGSGALNFGAVRIDLDNTRVTFSTDEENPDVPNVSDLTIDPGNDNNNVLLRLNNAPLEISGDLKNNGTFNPGVQRVTFNGSSTQDILSATGLEFSSLFIRNSGSTVRINSDADVTATDTLTLRQGTLAFRSGATNASLTVENQVRLRGGTLDASGGPVTLASNGDTEAYVDYSESGGTLDGQIVGDIIKQRELQGPANWYFVGSPVGTSANDTFNEFLQQGPETNDLWTQGFSGADDAPNDAENANVRFYDESVSGSDDQGWTAISGIDSEMESGRGYILFPFGDDNFDGTVDGDEQFPKLIDSKVEPYNNIAFDFTGTEGPGISVTDNGPGTSGAVGSEEGWNLLSNPYLTTLDWDQISRTNIDDAVYVYDPVNNQYLSYSSGSGTLDNGFIAPQQAFFVKASNGTDPGSATYGLDINNIVNVQADTADFFQKSAGSGSPTLVFQASLSGISRTAHIALRDDGEFEKDPNDAYQLGAPVSGSKGAFSLFTTLDNGTGLDINVIPRQITEKKTISMDAVPRGCVNGLPFGGTATLTWPEIRNMPEDVGLKIKDTKTGDVVDLRTQSEYTFSVTAETNCSSKTTSASSSNELPSLPAPEVVSVDQSKASGSGTRFELIIEPNGVLPVEFTSFTGSVADNAARLEWTTATEQNNAGFQVQQKVDGSFQNIDGAFVEGAGTSEEPQSYSYRVEDLDAGQHTFRLKQVDVDGGSSFSKETTVKVGLDSQYQLQAYPNPISEQATIKFAVKESQDVTLELYNTLGQRVQVLHQGSVPSSQTRTVSLQASDLSSGLYIVRMRGESFSTTKSVTVVQ